MNNELYHHGVKGQKWGVRSHRVSIHHRVSIRQRIRNAQQKKKQSYSDDYKLAHDKRDINQMSTAELKKVTEQLKAEKAYKEAVKGNSWAKNIAKKQFERLVNRITQPVIDAGADYIRNKTMTPLKSLMSGRNNNAG